MANAPAPVLTVTGHVHSIEKFERVRDAQTGESEEAARVTILTRAGDVAGGFLEVYVRPELMAVVEGLEPLEPVQWACEVDAWKRTYPSDRELPPSQRRSYASMRASFVAIAGNATAQRVA